MVFAPATDVWKITPLQREHAKDNELTRRIRRVLQRWAPFANEQFGEWEGRPNCGHFFGGGFWYVSDCASTSLVFAALAEFGDDGEEAAGIPRSLLRERAVKALRYVGFTHDTGPADCVRVKGVLPYTSEKKWGGAGDNFFMASQNGRSVAAIAATTWLLWDHLDEETKLLMQNVISSYADRWSAEEPRNGVYYDTQCEENAWTAAGISAGVALFREHPHHAQWERGFKRWAINAVTTYKDRLADPSGLIDNPAGNLVSTVTFHPDFTAENHAFVHPSYLCAGTNLRGLHAVLSLMGGLPIMPMALHNNENLYETTIKRWSQSDGLAVPVQGQDWWYNRQHERQLTHAILNVLHGNRDAARLERNALDFIERIQQSNSRGCLLEERGEECVINRAHAQFAKDLEHGSAVDLATSLLLHLFGGPGEEPADAEEMKARLSGVHVYPYGNAVVHRTPRTFSSFSWRNNVMVLTLPEQGIWNVTPLYSSYTGTMKLKGNKGVPGLSNEAIVRDTENPRIVPYADGFGATAVIVRGDRELRQQVAFVSLPNGATVYVEQFRALKDCVLEEAATGMIGIRNENYAAMPDWAPGSRTVHRPDGSDTFAGFFGDEPNFVREYEPARYVNVDDKIGYVVFGSRKMAYINKHQYPKWKGVEDILVLNEIGTLALGAGERTPPLAIVSLPNRTHRQTAEASMQTHWMETGATDLFFLETEGFIIYVNSSTSRRTLSAARQANPGESCLNLFAGSNEISGGMFSWTGSADAGQAGYIPASASVLLDPAFQPIASMRFFVMEKEIVLMNDAEQDQRLRLRIAANGEVVDLHLPAGSGKAVSFGQDG